MTLKPIMVFALFLLLVSCKDYKLLESDPSVTSIEGKFIPLKDGENSFELSNEKRENPNAS